MPCKLRSELGNYIQLFLHNHNKTEAFDGRNGGWGGRWGWGVNYLKKLKRSVKLCLITFD